MVLSPSCRLRFPNHYCYAAKVVKNVSEPFYKQVSNSKDQDGLWTPKKMEWTPPVFAWLLRNNAPPQFERFVELSREVKPEWLRTTCMRAVTSANNPFIPGMALSVALAGAAKRAPEGERRKLKILHDGIDDLLLEILERLPKTVLGFEKAAAGCSAVFEPELQHPGDNALAKGPLSMALENRTQTAMFCTSPLVIDFLSRKFTRGLPNWRDSGGILLEPTELEYLAGYTQGTQADRFQPSRDPVRQEDSLVISESDMPTKELGDFLKRNLQGADANAQDGHRMTLLPGIQFVTAGLLAKPNTYYEVPAMRMALDFVVYLGMLVFFCTLVLFHEDGALTWGEIVFAVYLVVSGKI